MVDRAFDPDPACNILKRRIAQEDRREIVLDLRIAEKGAGDRVADDAAVGRV